MIERYSHVRSEAKRRAVSVFDLAEPEKESAQISPQWKVAGNSNIM